MTQTKEQHEEPCVDLRYGRDKVMEGYLMKLGKKWEVFTLYIRFEVGICQSGGVIKSVAFGGRKREQFCGQHV